MSVASMIYAIVNLFASCKVICIHRYSGNRIAPSPTLFKTTGKIVSYLSAIMFSLIIREYDLISPNNDPFYIKQSLEKNPSSIYIPG